MAKKEKNNGTRNLILGIVIGVVIIGAIFMIYNSSVSNSNSNFGSQDSSSQNAQSSNAKSSCRDVEVPYQDTETYWDTESYTEKECHNENLKYAMLDRECDIAGFLGLDYEITCTLHNQDTEGGEFIMEAGGTFKSLWDDREEDFTANVGGYFYPDETKRYAYTFDKALSSCWCKIVSVPTKNVCEDVVKYRDVQKTRTITKYKTETQCD